MSRVGSYSQSSACSNAVATTNVINNAERLPRGAYHGVCEVGVGVDLWLECGLFGGLTTGSGTGSTVQEPVDLR